MKVLRALALVALLAHVPVVTPADHPRGDLPPVLEPSPLPAV